MCVCVYYSILCIVGLVVLPMVVVGALVFVGIKPVHDSQFSHAYNDNMYTQFIHAYNDNMCTCLMAHVMNRFMIIMSITISLKFLG